MRKAVVQTHHGFFKNKKIADAPNTSQDISQADRHDASATNTTVPQNVSGVNTQSMQNGGGNTQSAYIPEDQFVDRMGDEGQSLSHGDAVTAPFTQGGHAADADMSAVQVDEGAVSCTVPATPNS